MKYVLLAVTGTSFGMGAGIAIMAVITLLRIIPEMAGSKDTYANAALICFSLGAILFSDVRIGSQLSLALPNWVCIPVGLFIGAFIGCLLSALVEAINMFASIFLSYGLAGYMRLIIIVLAIAKACFSLLYWLNPIFR